jgi:hypothetical protein
MHIVLMGIRDFHENRRRECLFYECVWIYSYVCTVKPCVIFKVKNALAKFVFFGMEYATCNVATVPPMPRIGRCYFVNCARVLALLCGI